MAFEQQPPSEIRTGVELPQIKLTARLEHPDGSSDTSIIDSSELHGRATLVSVGGEDRTACSDPRILNGSFVERSQNRAGSAEWDLNLPRFTITESGHYQLHFTLMVVPSEESEGESLVGSRVSLLSIDSRVIHAHAFAPLL